MYSIPGSQKIPSFVPTVQRSAPKPAKMKFLSSVLLFLAPISLALPTNVVDSPAEDSIEARQCYVRCGSTCYTSAQVTGARNSGYNYIRQGGTAGGSSYPHRYNNYEGFDFLVSGPYYEFPLRTGGAYTGGKSWYNLTIVEQRADMN